MWHFDIDVITNVRLLVKFRTLLYRNRPNFSDGHAPRDIQLPPTFVLSTLLDHDNRPSIGVVIFFNQTMQEIRPQQGDSRERLLSGSGSISCDTQGERCCGDSGGGDGMVGRPGDHWQCDWGGAGSGLASSSRVARELRWSVAAGHRRTRRRRRISVSAEEWASAVGWWFQDRPTDRGPSFFVPSRGIAPSERDAGGKRSPPALRACESTG
jgi:hypothetical protein